MILSDGVILSKTDNVDFIEKCRLALQKTHFNFNNKSISDIGTIVLCRNATVLFLNDNQLNETIGLKDLVQLTHLYLTNNRIKRISGFQKLVNLQKLYLGRNEIAVLENLQNCYNLEILHVNDQLLPYCDKLVIDPLSLNGMQKLKEFDVSGNKITDIKYFDKLNALEILDISCNNIIDFDFLISVISCTRVINLNCNENPFCNERYQIPLISMTCISILNGNEISENIRVYYKSMNKKKISKYPVSIDVQEIMEELPNGIKEAVNRPEDYREHIDLINKRDFDQIKK